MTRLTERLRYRAVRLRRGLAKSGLLAFGAAPPTRFMVLCRARTGSNFLLSLLEMHPRSLVYGEKLRAGGDTAAHRFLDGLGGRHAWWVQAVGFKMFYEHPLDREAPALWQRLIGDQELAVIHLRRRNLLHVLLSETLARRSDHWVQRSDQRQAGGGAGPVEMDAEWLKREFRRIEQQGDELDRRLADHRLLKVEYETLCNRMQEEFDRLCRFLDLPPAPARAYTLRQRRRPVSELIANYSELKACFKGSPWERFFEEGEPNP